MYGIKKNRLKKILKKQKENIFQFKKISDETKLDIPVNIVDYQELTELEIYFNSNILGTYLLLEEIKNDDNNRLFEHNTDLIFLYIQSLWDYILQYINTYFSLELVESDNEHASIKDEQKEFAEYLEENEGELNELYIEEAEEFIKRKFKVVRKNNVITLLKNKYEISGILEKIIVILEDKNMNLAKYRNKVAHQKSTKSKIDKSKNWFNGDEIVTFNKDGNVNKGEVLTVIKEELGRLKEVLNCLYTIKINGLYPNLKENADKIYKVQNIKCKNCETNMQIPIPNTLQEDMLETMDFLKIFTCRNCSLREFDVDEIQFSTERGYMSLFINQMMNKGK